MKSAFLLTAVLATCWPDCKDGKCAPEIAAAATSATVMFEIIPPDGELWIGGQRVAGGRVVTAALPPGPHRLDAVVRWSRGGQVVERKIQADVRAGQSLRIPVTLPVAPPPGDFIEGASREKDGSINYGLDPDKTPKPATESFTLNGFEVGRVQAKQVLTAGLPDDRPFLRLTAIGPKEWTQQIVGDLAGSDVKDRLLIQTYTPDAWAVKDAGFKPGNQIYLTAPDGKVLHRQEDYAGGGPKLIEAVRKAQASYRPDLDPDLRHESDQAWLLIVVALGAFWALTQS